MSKIPNSSIKLIGYEVKYAILEGGMIMPAVAIRGAYTKLSGIDQVDVSTKSVDVSISKGIAIFTPYAGVGQVWISSDPHNSTTFSGTPLQSEEHPKVESFRRPQDQDFPLRQPGSGRRLFERKLIFRPLERELLTADRIPEGPRAFPEALFLCILYIERTTWYSVTRGNQTRSI